MRLIVLDTNVVISAGIRRTGPPAILMNHWLVEQRLQAVTCPWIIGEYREVARREKLRRCGFPPPWLESMMDGTLLLPDPPDWPHPIPDPKDAPFLALAHTAGAWLVTGNLKHFPKTGRRGVTVLSPAEYLSHLQESSRRS
jgi:predicted nucleic acid-binding protein